MKKYGPARARLGSHRGAKWFGTGDDPPRPSVFRCMVPRKGDAERGLIDETDSHPTADVHGHHRGPGSLDGHISPTGPDRDVRSRYVLEGRDRLNHWTRITNTSRSDLRFRRSPPRGG